MLVPILSERVCHCNYLLRGKLWVRSDGTITRMPLINPVFVFNMNEKNRRAATWLHQILWSECHDPRPQLQLVFKRSL